MNSWPRARTRCPCVDVRARIGLGTTYRLWKWLGVNADYRHFVVNATDTQHINRFTTGISLFLK